MRNRIGVYVSRLKSLRSPSQIKATRQGKFFVGLTLGVAFAAVSTGNNPLYLVMGMLLGLLIVSSIMSELNLRNLTVMRILPRRAQVGRPHQVEIEVVNCKRYMPSFAIEIEDLRADQPADKRCFFLKISPQSMQIAAYRRTPATRGCDTHTGFRIATRFPFGLFEKSREILLDGELIIYPAIGPVTLAPLLARHHPGGNATFVRGQDDDYLGIKLLREGEDPRDVHWRKSASVGQLVMRERARNARPDVVLSLDVLRPDNALDDWQSLFERKIGECASRTVAHIKRGDGVAIRTTSGCIVHANRMTGADPILRFLALVDSIPSATLSGAKGAMAVDVASDLEAASE
jgi:uncharacterized protein (DUF58 family)